MVTHEADQAAEEDDETNFWLAMPGFRESLIEIEADIAAGRTFSAEEVCARFGLQRLKVPESFDDPLPDSEIALWEGREQPPADGG